MSVFVDTSALYAILDADDEVHAAAKTSWSSLLDVEETLVTSNYILVETFALTQHRLGMRAVATLADEILPLFDVQWVEPSEHQAALRAVMAAGRRKLSMVDCTSFEVMRRLHLRDVFAFDSHFEEQGFTLQPEQQPEQRAD